MWAGGERGSGGTSPSGFLVFGASSLGLGGEGPGDRDPSRGRQREGYKKMDLTKKHSCKDRRATKQRPTHVKAAPPVGPVVFVYMI